MTVTMYDDINLDLIPKNAEAVAGYVNGRWPTYKDVVRRWPRAHHLSIAVSSNADADCLDVETGDATNAVAPAWVKRQQKRGILRPVVYSSVSNAQALLDTLAHQGITRLQVRLWTAHYTHSQHICGPGCGFGLKEAADATQWTDKAQGKSLDASLCNGAFFLLPKPTPVPTPKPKPVPNPPPKPTPPPNTVKTYLQLLNKDGSETYEPYSALARLRRGLQFAHGKFTGIQVVNKKQQ